MEIVNFKNKKHILLSENIATNYYLVASTEEEVNEILLAKEKQDNSKYPFINEIELIGETKRVTNGMLSPYIPIEHTFKRKEPIGFEKTKIVTFNEFQCYARYNKEGKNFTNNTIIHENCKSSLNCASEQIGSPKYSYLIAERKESFKNKIENATINN